MASKLTDQVVDKRLVERNIRKGLIDRKGVNKHIADTKDMATNVEMVPYYDPEPEEEAEAPEASVVSEHLASERVAPEGVASEGVASVAAEAVATEEA